MRNTMSPKSPQPANRMFTEPFIKRAVVTGLAAAIFWSAAGAFGQDQATSSSFELFENLETTGPNNQTSGRNTQNVRQPGAIQTTPVFTLVGTARIGSKQSVMLKHLGGEVVRVPLTGAVSPIPGHELYSVVGYGPERVDVRYPAAVTCGNFAEQGISCNTDTNIATLSLTTAEAIVRAPEAREEALEAESETVAAASPDTPRNPFEALRDRAQNGDSPDSSQATRFQPRRIDPADVPPGMRVVSTPFGDRLVENN